MGCDQVRVSKGFAAVFVRLVGFVLYMEEWTTHHPIGATFIKGFCLQTAGIGWSVCKTSALAQRAQTLLLTLSSFPWTLRCGVTYFLIVMTLLSTRKNRHGQFPRHMI
ncbi:hypothetical protein EDC04DRAFT_1805749 [Pisolithus marmoratus]|nr:hypothetical protein EDC04DRAFT_1805749 [Pisolithus marmoratus]